jgi:hypothetical protein
MYVLLCAIRFAAAMAAKELALGMMDLGMRAFKPPAKAPKGAPPPPAKQHKKDPGCFALDSSRGTTFLI